MIGFTQRRGGKQQRGGFSGGSIYMIKISLRTLQSLRRRGKQNNMRFITSILLIALLAAVAEYFLPWWSLAAVAFAVALMMKLKPGQAFLSGFLGIALLWAGIAIWRDMANDHILADRLAVLILKVPNHWLFVVLTAVVGGLVGGFAAWSGALLRKNV